MLTNQMADSFNGYTFTLVLAGRLTLVGGHGELQQGDYQKCLAPHGK